MAHSSSGGHRSLETRDKLSAEQKLWLAVLGAAASDAVSDAELDYKGYFISKHMKRADIEYFLNPNRNFYQVCHWAGLDPEYVQRKMKAALCQEK